MYVGTYIYSKYVTTYLMYASKVHTYLDGRYFMHSNVLPGCDK